VFARDYERASEQALKTLELYPGSLLAWWGLGLAEMCRSRHAEAIRAFERGAAISPEPLSIAYLGVAQAERDASTSRKHCCASFCRDANGNRCLPGASYSFTQRPEINTTHSDGRRKPMRVGTQAFSGSELCPSMIRCVQLQSSRKCYAESGSHPIDAQILGTSEPLGQSRRILIG
jgi:tetratricopeptide (TPR) repeat protein